MQGSIMVADRKILAVNKNEEYLISHKVRESKHAYDFAKHFWEHDINIYESVFIIMLARDNRIMAYAKVSQGGRSSSVMDPAIVAKYAVDVLASAVIVVHNHPSGNKEPSNIDINIAKTIKKGLELFAIDMLDSMIIVDGDYYSMLDEGNI